MVRSLFLLILIVIIQQSFSAEETYKIHEDPSGKLCFWQGDAPWCFIGSGCPTRTMTMKKDKSGDGEYCWLGYKFYCCLI